MASPGCGSTATTRSPSIAATEWAAERARANHGPTLIEHFTYRSEGHSTSDDPTKYRSAEERTAWPLGDPIARLKAHLIAIGAWDEERHAAMDKEVAEQVRAAAREAEAQGVLGDGLHQPFTHDVRGRVRGDAVAPARAIGADAGRARGGGAMRAACDRRRDRSRSQDGRGDSAR